MCSVAEVVSPRHHARLVRHGPRGRRADSVQQLEPDGGHRGRDAGRLVAGGGHSLPSLSGHLPRRAQRGEAQALAALLKSVPKRTMELKSSTATTSESYNCSFAKTFRPLRGGGDELGFVCVEHD